MKLHVSVLIAAGFAVCASAATNAPVLRAGAAAVDITPKEFPLDMPGGFSANMADAAHDPLHARSLAFDDGMTKLAVVIVDNLGVADEVVKEAKTIAAKQCDIPVERMMVAATHSHSAPPCNSKKVDSPEGSYRKVLVDGIADSIVRANAVLRPAAIGTGVQPLPEEVFNRRWFLKPGKMPLNPFGKMDEVKMNPGTTADVLDHPAGPTDPDVTVVDVQDAKTRKPLALLASYSLHYVGGTPRGKVSADYYGEFARLMPSRVGAGDDFVAIMANGTSGNINNIPFLVTRPPREPFEQIRIVAGKVGDAAWFARKNIEKHQTAVRVGMVQREITLKRRIPTAEQIAAAKAVLAVTNETEMAKLPPLADNYARRVLSLANGGEKMKVVLQALRIGDLAICANPFETFVEIGLDLKKRSPFPRTIAMGISNGYGGYMPTPEQHKLGGYETWLGTCSVQEDASVIITDNLLAMLEELRKMD